MATIQDLKNLKLKQIPDTYKGLVEGITQLIEDYENESDKAFFEKEAQANIDAYFEMVQSVLKEPNTSESDKTKEDSSPKTSKIKKGDNKPKKSRKKKERTKKPGDDGNESQSNEHKILKSHYNRLLDLTSDYEEEGNGDLEGFFENILDALKDILDADQDQKIPSLVAKAVEPTYAHAEGLEQNQRIRLGDVDDIDLVFCDKVSQILDKLQQELKAESDPEPKKKANPPKDQIPLRKITTDTIKVLKAIQSKLGGKDKEAISMVRFELEEALDQSDDKTFIEGVKQAINNFDKDNIELEKTDDQKKVIQSIKKIKDGIEAIEQQQTERKKKSQGVLKKMAVYEQNIEACRQVIREFNKKKRESAPDKPKPSRRTLLKKRVLSIIRLTPEALSSDPLIIAENRKIVKNTITAFMKNWGMTNVQQVERAVDKEFDLIEDKIEEQEDKELLKQWSKDLPDADKIMAQEKKHNKALLDEAVQGAADEILKAIKEAISLYKTDKQKALEYLKANLDERQLKAYLPKYILDELTTKAIEG